VNTPRHAGCSPTGRTPTSTPSRSGTTEAPSGENERALSQKVNRRHTPILVSRDPALRQEQVRLTQQLMLLRQAVEPTRSSRQPQAISAVSRGGGCRRGTDWCRKEGEAVHRYEGTVNQVMGDGRGGVVMSPRYGR